MATIEELDDLVTTAMKLARELKSLVFPNGKPDWMTDKQWDETKGIDR